MIHQATSNLQLLDEQIFSERIASAISVFLKVCGWRPNEGGAAHAGAGVRKPPMEETAGSGRGGASDAMGFDGCRA